MPTSALAWAGDLWPILPGPVTQGLILTATLPFFGNQDLISYQPLWAQNSYCLLVQKLVNVCNYRVPSVQFSPSVVSDSLQPHELQHTKPPCPSPTPGVHSISCPSSQWCHPAISSSVIPFSSCFQSLPASGSFPVSQLFTWGGQSIGISASASVLPMNTQNWSPLGSLLPPSKLKSFSITISSNNFSDLFSFISGTPSLMWMLFCLILS